MGGEVVDKPVKLFPPSYPSYAENNGVNGLVDFAFTVQPDGSVDDAQVIQEVPQCFGFAKAAEKVFPRWKFAPKLIDDKAVAFQATYRFQFKLAILAPPKAP